MGNNISEEEKREKAILAAPQIGKASALYWACRDGDVDAVRKLLKSMDYASINHLEPNGSTPLHAAAYFGHAEVVRLLLRDYSVERHQRNRYDKTAYEDAGNDEIRALFHRSAGANRFCDTSDTAGQSIFESITSKLSDDENDVNELEDEWVDAVISQNEIKLKQALQNIAKHLAASSFSGPLIVGFLKLVMKTEGDILDVFDKTLALDCLQSVIEEHVTPEHPDYRKAFALLSKYRDTNDINSLFCLYTLETPFYTAVHDVSGAFTIRVLSSLKQLRKRAHTGVTFRGLKMTEEYLRPYEWLYKHKNGILVNLATLPTTIDETVATGFSTKNPGTGVSVIMVFNFPEPCDTAIQLFQLSEDLPNISEFEEEHEVLVLCCTLFRVTNMETDKPNNRCRIYLEHVQPQGRWLQFLKTAWDERND